MKATLIAIAVTILIFVIVFLFDRRNYRRRMDSLKMQVAFRRTAQSLKNPPADIVRRWL